MNRTAWWATGFLILATGVTTTVTGCSDGAGTGATALDNGGTDGGTLTSECPSVVSNIDAACNVVSSVTCYSNDSRLYPDGPECEDKAVQCVDAHWKELPQTESEPTVTCPATPPAEGDACPMLTCSSKNKDCFYDCAVASCHAGDAHWRVTALATSTSSGDACIASDAGTPDAGDGG